ncbi:MAG: GntR family transcriptional regulator [Gemmatimonadota bacterium]
MPIPSAADPDSPYARLLHLIVRGRLSPGTPLTEAVLARRLGVSRTPVREALHRLEHDRLAIPAGGGDRLRLMVAPLSAAEVSEVYAAAGALEGVAARNVTSLGQKDREALAKRLASHDAAFRRAARAATLDWDVLFDTHDAFHRELQDAAAGVRIRALLDELRPQVDRYEWLFAPLTGPDFTGTYAEHGAIVRAVRGGSVADVERAVRANWFNGGARLAAVIRTSDTLLLTGSAWSAA